MFWALHRQSKRDIHKMELEKNRETGSFSFVLFCKGFLDGGEQNKGYHYRDRR